MTVWFQIGLLSVLIFAMLIAIYLIAILRRTAKSVTVNIKFTVELWHIIAIWVAVIALVAWRIVL
jgi:Kef-type K+ transport system membrane component KefB